MTLRLRSGLPVACRLYYPSLLCDAIDDNASAVQDAPVWAILAVAYLMHVAYAEFVYTSIIVQLFGQELMLGVAKIRKPA